MVGFVVVVFLAVVWWKGTSGSLCSTTVGPRTRGVVWAESLAIERHAEQTHSAPHTP